MCKHVSITWEEMAIDPTLHEGEDIIYLPETVEQAGPQWKRRNLENNIIVRPVHASTGMHVEFPPEGSDEESYLKKWKKTVLKTLTCSSNVSDFIFGRHLWRNRGQHRLIIMYVPGVTTSAESCCKSVLEPDYLTVSEIQAWNMMTPTAKNLLCYEVKVEDNCTNREIINWMIFQSPDTGYGSLYRCRMVPASEQGSRLFSLSLPENVVEDLLSGF